MPSICLLLLLLPLASRLQPVVGENTREGALQCRQRGEHSEHHAVDSSAPRVRACRGDAMQPCAQQLAHDFSACTPRPGAGGCTQCQEEELKEVFCLDTGFKETLLCIPAGEAGDKPAYNVSLGAGGWGWDYARTS